jgi:hypothetical protein
MTLPSESTHTLCFSNQAELAFTLELLQYPTQPFGLVSHLQKTPEPKQEDPRLFLDATPHPALPQL